VEVDPSQQIAVAGALLAAAAVTLTPDEPVTFKSGLISPVYVDNRRLTFHPAAWRIVIEAFAATLGGRPPVDVIAGVEAAGIPHSSGLAYAISAPSVFVRKEAKDHGLGHRIEGGDVSGRRVVLVEDMVTTGSSSLSAIGALREAGAEVDTCFAIITYGFAETREAFEADGIELVALTTFETVVEEAVRNGSMDERAASMVRAWLIDPHGWATA
jgi:orotate phosphoribosyltransferase